MREVFVKMRPFHGDETLGFFLYFASMTTQCIIRERIHVCALAMLVALSSCRVSCTGLEANI